MVTGPGVPCRGAVARQRAHLTTRHMSRPDDTEHWQIHITHPGSGWDTGIDDLPDGHRPTILADTGRRGLGGRYRGACLGCDYEGPDRARANEAVEDAHDHTHPGWRDLPVIQMPATRVGMRGGAAAGWLAVVEASYPPGWFERGGPIITYRDDGDLRHRPAAAPGGGYDLSSGGHRLPDSQRYQRRTIPTSGGDDQIALFG